MRILALTTSTGSGSIALLEGATVRAQQLLPPSPRTAQTLVPGIASLLDEVTWTPAEIGLVAVDIGPGSFTGLRVGIATAKTLAYALHADILGVSSLELLALQAHAGLSREFAASPHAELTTVLDAHRGQLFAQTWSADDAGLTAVHPPSLVEVDDWLAELTAERIVSGQGLKKLVDRIPEGVVTGPRECWIPDAVVLGQHAARLYASGRRSDVWSLAPMYLRASAAEEKFG